MNKKSSILSFQQYLYNPQQISNKAKYKLQQKKKFSKLLSVFKKQPPRIKLTYKKRIQTQNTLIGLNSNQNAYASTDLRMSQRQTSQNTQSPIRTKRQIQIDINESLKIINAIKDKKFKILNKQSRYITQPTIFQTPKKQRLFSYLERDILYKKEFQPTKKDIKNFFSSYINKTAHQKIRMNSRRFLQNAAYNDFHNFHQVKDQFFQDSKILIKGQIKKRKQKYSSQYRVRNNCPYFSYLTLNKQQKQAVLNRINRRPALINNINVLDRHLNQV